MANQQEDSGFILPQPGSQASSASSEAAAPDAGATSSQSAVSGTPAIEINVGQTDTSSRDLIIGGSILIVLAIAFLFLRRAWANSLVGKKVPPAKANQSGWWLWLFLVLLFSVMVLGVINADRFLTPIFLAPAAIVAVVALILTFVTGRK